MPDRLAGEHRSENKGSGAGATHPAVVEAPPGRVIGPGGSCGAESEGVAERREWGQCRRMKHADREQRPQVLRKKIPPDWSSGLVRPTCPATRFGNCSVGRPVWQQC